MFSQANQVTSKPANGESLPARLSRLTTDWSGSSSAFWLAFLTIVIWLASGPIFGFSDTWQLIINTGTTIITFLMVFLIQRAQNKDSRAVHLKLNELLAAVKGASNRLIDVENLTEEEIKALHAYYSRLVMRTKTDGKRTEFRFVEDAVKSPLEKMKNE